MRAESWICGVLAALCMPLTGCVTTKTASPDGKALELPHGRMVLRVDRDYVARVEAIARKNGTRVHWVNPPLKRIESE